MRSTVVVSLKSSTSKVCRNPNPRPNQPGSCPPFITPCFESVIGRYIWPTRRVATQNRNVVVVVAQRGIAATNT